MRHTILTLLLFLTLTAAAGRLPEAEGERTRHNVELNLGRAKLTGVCLMLMEEGLIKASIVNEFGVSYVDFTYSPKTKKLRLVSVAAPLDKWYIRKRIRKELRKIAAPSPSLPGGRAENGDEEKQNGHKPSP